MARYGQPDRKTGIQTGGERGPAFFSGRFLACGLALIALPLVLMFVPPRAPQNGWWWDILMAAGMAGASLMLAIPALSPRAWIHFGGDPRHLRLLLRLHLDASYIVAGLIVIHTIGLVVIEPTLIEYLKLSAPWSMLAAIVSAVLVFVLILSSLYRTGFKLPYRTWLIWHIGLSTTAMALMVFHVVDAGYFINSPSKTIAFVALAAGPSLVAFGTGRWTTLAQTRRHARPEYDAVEVHYPSNRSFSFRILSLVVLLWLTSVAVLAIPGPGTRAERQTQACQERCG